MQIVPYLADIAIYACKGGPLLGLSQLFQFFRLLFYSEFQKKSSYYSHIILRIEFKTQQLYVRFYVILNKKSVARVKELCKSENALSA